MRVDKQVVINRFRVIETEGPITVDELAEKLSTPVKILRTWLSRMTDYKCPDGTRKSYLVYKPPEVASHRQWRGDTHVRVRNQGTYSVNPKHDWSELYT